MRKMSAKILCLVLSFEIALGAYPIRAIAERPEQIINSSVPTPDAVINAYMEEGQELFGEGGCATIDKNNKVTLRTDTTVDGVSDGTRNASLDCGSRVKNFQAVQASVKKMIEDGRVILKEDGSIDCVNCSYADRQKEKEKLADANIPEGGICSKNEKDKIAHQRKTDPACSWGCEFLSWEASSQEYLHLGFLTEKVGSFMGAKPGCINKHSEGTLGCLGDIVKSFFSSLGSMVKSAYEGVVAGLSAAKNWVGSWFSKHKEAEQASTQDALMKSVMSDDQIKEAQKDPKKANEHWYSSFGNFFTAVFENLVGLDVPAYKELWQCAKCGGSERLAAICKMVGVLGKDVVRNAIVMWVGGVAINKIVIGLGGKIAKSSVNLIKKAPVGETFVNWTSKTWSSKISTPVLNRFNKWVATDTGKAVAHLTSRSLKGMDDLMMFPQTIVVKAGKGMVNSAARLVGREAVFKSAIKGAAAAEIANVALNESANALEKSTQGVSSIAVESERPFTVNTKKSESYLSKLKSFEDKRFKSFNTAGINDIEKTPFTEIGDKGIFMTVPEKSGALVGEVKPKIEYIKINPNEVKAVHQWNEGANALIEKTNGDVALVQNGKVIRTLSAPKGEVAKIESLVSNSEKRAAAEIKLQEVKANLEGSGQKVTEENATPVPEKEGVPGKEEKIKTKCNDEDVNLTIKASA